MPRIIKGEQVAVWLQGIIPGRYWVPWMPERIDKLVFLIPWSVNLWVGTSDGIRVVVNWTGTVWLVEGYLDPEGHTCFSGTMPELVNGFVQNTLTWAGYNFYGGQAWVIVEPVENQVAVLAGALTGPESFYEPMPLASPHRSFRYARHFDGTRIYVRMEG